MKEYQVCLNIKTVLAVIASILIIIGTFIGLMDFIYTCTGTFCPLIAPPYYPLFLLQVIAVISSGLILIVGIFGTKKKLMIVGVISIIAFLITFGIFFIFPIISYYAITYTTGFFLVIAGYILAIIGGYEKSTNGGVVYG